MPLFDVTLRNLGKPDVAKVVQVHAASAAQAGAQAKREGWGVALVKPRSKAGGGVESLRIIPSKELIKLFRGLSSMLRANISTADSLTYYAQGVSNPRLKAVLSNIAEKVEAGVPIHQAFSGETKLEPTILTVIEAGADAAQLHMAFASMAARIKTALAFSSKLRSALSVPCAVIAFQIVLFIWSQLSVVKNVEDTLKSVRQAPDPLSKMIFSFSHVVQATWPFFVAAIVSFLIWLWRSASLRQFLLNVMMKRWSLLRKLVMGLRQSAYLGTLEMLYGSGISLARSAALAARVVSGTRMYDELAAASRTYETSGTTFAEALNRHTEVDPQVIHMIGIGEKSASLTEQLRLLREIYEEDTQTYMSDFTQVINFITLALAVFIIGLVFAGAMLPIFLMGPRMMNSGNM
ncbi:MAG: putative type II secretion system protein F [Prosthecobacter sp.]|jgi:type II secretory pathway component PulF|nr:putative type II secretion system protein F [Prosthecobacter sp.]